MFCHLNSVHAPTVYMLLMAQRPSLRSGGGSDGCARCFGTSGRPSQWSWLLPFITAVMWGLRRTTAYGHRRQRAQGSGPGFLTEPEPRGREGESVTVGHVAAPVPLLAVPLLAGAAGHAGSQVLVVGRQWSSHSCSFEEIVGVPVFLDKVVNVSVVKGVRVQQVQGVDDSRDPTVAARWRR